MKTVENIGFNNLKLVQDEDGFKFGVDGVILADFANSMCPRAVNAADLGTGNGIIPTVLTHKNKACHITGIDVQQAAIDIALEGRGLNGLEDRIDFIRCDICNIREEQEHLRGTMDLVVSNPPYVAKGSGIVNGKSRLMIARQETTADLETFVQTAAWFLKERGSFCMIHRPSRLVDIFYFCRKYRLEPKNIRFVAPSRGKKPNIVMVHCILGGGHELNYMETLNVYDSKGVYSPEIHNIYEKTY